MYLAVRNIISSVLLVLSFFLSKMVVGLSESEVLSAIERGFEHMPAIVTAGDVLAVLAVIIMIALSFKEDDDTFNFMGTCVVLSVFIVPRMIHSFVMIAL